MHRLVALGIGKPARERVLIRRAELGHHDVRRGAVRSGQREGCDIAGPRAPMTDDVDAGALTRCVLGEPAPKLPGLQSSGIEVEATFWHDLVLVGQRLEQPIAQHPKLQAIEELVSRLTVPGASY